MTAAATTGKPAAKPGASPPAPPKRNTEIDARDVTQAPMDVIKAIRNGQHGRWIWLPDKWDRPGDDRAGEGRNRGPSRESDSMWGKVREGIDKVKNWWGSDRPRDDRRQDGPTGFPFPRESPTGFPFSSPDAGKGKGKQQDAPTGFPGFPFPDVGKGKGMDDGKGKGKPTQFPFSFPDAGKGKGTTPCPPEEKGKERQADAIPILFSGRRQGER